MTLLILRLTVGQLVRQRRTLLLVILAALPVALAILFRVTGGTPEHEPDFPVGLLAHFTVGLILPLTALVIGTAALGQELEDGTIVYLVGKPMPRWNVVLAKIAAAWLVTSAVVVVSVVVSGAVMLAGYSDLDLVPAFSAAALLGALAYSAMFVSLSIRFGRALIIGLTYVFIWETLVSQFIVGVRFLSVRAYTLSVAESLADPRSQLLEHSLGVVPALILVAVLVTGATVYGIRRLDRYQISERV
jgi:ABC-2 type transport system permease protein